MSGTPSSESNTRGEQFDREDNNVMVGDKQPLTPSSRDTKAFHEEPGCLLARSRQNMRRRRLETPSILRKLPESENLVSSATAMDENGQL